MSASQGQASGGSGNNQTVAPDPTKIIIKIEGHAECFVVDRQTAITHSLFVRAAMTGPFLNAITGIIELEESDYAIPATVGLLRDYLKWRQQVDVHAGNDNDDDNDDNDDDNDDNDNDDDNDDNDNDIDDNDDDVDVDFDFDLPGDPIQELEHFGELANFWLLADYLQSETITNAIMEEFEVRAEDLQLLDEEHFTLWWEKLEHQPAWDALRGVMLALFVASNAIQEAAKRHVMMPRLPVSAQMAIVDEILRQRDDVREEFSTGLELLEDHVDDVGATEIDLIRSSAAKTVAASDYFKSYTNSRDRP